ncbi:MAG: hypothetical protein DYG94_10100 [Leptolyngbya sp. PLA3]|nr:MAG: hypothetical protein EDM82_05245 [Cyanobacteria bacterium CYA]MCE7969082.1 hypothetical protein [Leptolyngbya sp. PL-A3]
MTISIPLDSVVQHDVFDTIATTKVILPDDLGVVVIQERRSKRLDLSVEAVADEVITQLLELSPMFDMKEDAGRAVRNPAGQLQADVVGTRAKVLSRDRQYGLAGYNADHAYVAIPREGTLEYTIRGSTLLQTDPGRFVLFELYTTASDFTKARETYEVMLATAAIEDQANIATRRAAMLDAGVKALAQLTESDYRAVFSAHPQRWERLSRPTPTGAASDEEELGYRRVQARVGKRGDLSPNKPKEKWTTDDQQDGYIVQIDARLLEIDSIIDTRAAYFLSLDRTEEAWVVNMAVRKEADVSRWQEIGARLGTDMSINVIPEQLQATKIRPQIQGEGYISVVESYMLPQLLVHIGIPADFAFYSYQTSSSTIRLRTDSLATPKGKGGPWTLTTRLNADAPPQTTVIGPDGKILRTDLADGRRWSPIEFDALYNLWKSKGLPLD